MIYCQNIQQFLDIFKSGKIPPKHLRLINDNQYKDLTQYCKDSEEPIFKYTLFGYLSMEGLSGLPFNKDSFLDSVKHDRSAGGLTGLGICYYKGIGYKQNSNKAIKSFLEAWNNYQDVNALFYLALIDYDKKDIKAFEKFKQCVDEFDYIDAYYYMGLCYETGFGVELNIDKCKELFEKGALMGDNMAQHDLAVLLKKEKDFVNAKHYFKMSAKRNNDESIIELAMMYLKDTNELSLAVECLQDIINNHKNSKYFGKALAHLAECYFEGKGVIPNEILANQYLQEALILKEEHAYFLKAKYEPDSKAKILALNKLTKNVDASIELANCYFQEKNFNNALKYYSRVDKLGEYDFTAQIIECGLNLKNYKLCLNKANKLYEKGNKYGFYYLGYLYFKGFGVKYDFNKKEQYLQAFIDLADDEKDKNLILEANKMLKVDPKDSEDNTNLIEDEMTIGEALLKEYNLEPALEHFQKANSSDKTGQANSYIAEIYLKKKEYSSAFEAAELSLKAGNKHGAYLAGVCYFEGWGTDKNYRKALEAFRIAYIKDKKTDGIVDAAHYLYLLAIENISQYKKASNNKKIAFNYAKEGTEAGVAICKLDYADCLYFGHGCDVDFTGAFNIYEESYENNDLKALAASRLGLCYEKGCGVEIDIEKAKTLYLEALEGGVSNCLTNLAKLYINEQDDEKAFAILNNANYEKDGEGYFLLAKYLYKGIQVAKNIKLAYQYFKNYIPILENLSNGKNPDALACHYLALYYGFDDGEDKDENKEYGYANKAYAVDKCYANLRLVIKCLAQGRGVKKDEQRAKNLLEEACKNNVLMANDRMGRYYDRRDAPSCEQDDPIKAFEFYQKEEEINKENPDCLAKVGDCYLHGFGVAQDLVKGLDMLKKASENGSYLAKRYLGLYYLRNNHVDEGLENLASAADNAMDVFASYDLAKYYNGEGFNNSNRDIEKAKKYYDICVKNNYFEKECLVKYNQLEEEIYNIKINDAHKNNTIHIEGNRKDVFISWNHNNKDIKDYLYSQLEENEVCTVWQSDRDCMGGHLQSVLDHAVRQSLVLLVIATGNILNSDYIPREIQYFVDANADIDPEMNRLIPIFINAKRNPETQEIEYFDVIKAIQDIPNPDSPFKQLLDKGSSLSFTYLDGVLQHDDKAVKDIANSITGKIFDYQKLKYREYLRNKKSYFYAADESVVKSLSDKINVVRKLEINQDYIPLQLNDENGYKCDDVQLLNPRDNVALLCGVMGLGKSVFISRLIYLNNIGQNYFFYLDMEDKDTRRTFKEEDTDFVDILLSNFQSIVKDDNLKPITRDSLDDIFTKEINSVIFIDNFDDVVKEQREDILIMIKKFMDKYGETKIIFSSRKAKDKADLEETLGKDISTFTLVPPENLIEQNFEIIQGLVKKRNEGFRADIVDMNSSNNLQLKDFDKIFAHLDDEIKMNPFWISNFLFLCLFNNKLPVSIIDILERIADLWTSSLEADFSEKFNQEYDAYNIDFDRMLENIAFKRLNNDKREIQQLIIGYLERNYKNIDENDYERIADGIYAIWFRKYIITNEEEIDNLSLKTMRHYYAALNLYHTLFKTEDDDTGTTLVFKSDKSKEIIETYFTNEKLFSNDLDWNTTACYLALKIVSKLDDIGLNKIEKGSWIEQVFNIYKKNINRDTKQMIKGVVNDNLAAFSLNIFKLIK